MTRKPDQRTERIRIWLGWIVAAAGVLALYMSWGALTDLALAAGIPGERAWVFPLIVDLPVVASMLIGIVVEPTTRGRGALPWIVFTVFTAATVAGNAERVRAIPAEQLHVEGWVAVLVHATPPVAVLLLTHLAVVTVYRPGRAKATVRTEQTTPAPVQTVARATAPRTGTPDQAAKRGQVLALWAEDRTVPEIVLQTGVPKTTVRRWVGADNKTEREAV